jgi:phospholipid-transporting ATPase
MDGPSFKFFREHDPEHRRLLLRIGTACRSVIACRLTPVQKQMLVNLVKVDTVPKATCLSIGDGANDVSMIREADVGVGIFGKEGRQAANNADFAVGQFKFLRKLLLVHGRWNYCRQSKVFLYSMHKNMVITLTLFWFRY